MKILFISDVHGAAGCLAAALEQGEALGYDRLVLLGDLLYHGPRRSGPSFYDTERTVELLNARRDRILAVRGNCDADDDQFALVFPMLDDFAQLDADGERFFLTHGHIWNERDLPPQGTGNILVHGHTHVPLLRRLDNGMTVFNPGSVDLPRGGGRPSFGYWDGRTLSHHYL